MLDPDSTRQFAPIRFTGVVLAGGQSRRFGDRNKALAVVDGSTFVAHAVRAVGSAVERSRGARDESAGGAAKPPVVAVETDDQRATVKDSLPPELDPRFSFDAAEFEGPLSGLYGALSAVKTDWLFVTACDMPRLSARAIAWLAGRLGSRANTADALVPEHSDGHPEPLHGFYRREAVAAVRDELGRETSLRALLDALDAATVPIPSAPPGVSLSVSVENVNTRKEYRRLCRSI